MTMSPLACRLAALFLLVGACSKPVEGSPADASVTSDGGHLPAPDASVADAATPDAAMRDASVAEDAAMPDAAVTRDASPEDAHVPDATVSPISLLPEPGLVNPRLHFATGGVVNNAPELFPTTPIIDGYPESPWYVAQWKKNDIMRPDLWFAQAPSTQDPLLGLAAWAFPTPSDESHVWIYAPPAPSLLVFELYGEHGWLDAAGGSNVLLSSNMIAEELAVPDHRVELTLDAKVRRQVTSYGDAASMTDGSVAWQYFTGLVFQYLPSGGGPRSTLFLQIRHADSRATVGTYLNANGTVAIYGGLLPGDVDLAVAPNAPLTHLQFDLTRYLCDAVSSEYPSVGGGTFQYPALAHDLSRWRLVSIYHGIETQDALVNMASARRGAAAVAVQVSNLDVRKHLEEAVLPACP